MNSRKYQLIKWYPRWVGFGFHRVSGITHMRLVYRWFMWFGFWEVRKWQDRQIMKRMLARLGG